MSPHIDLTTADQSAKEKPTMKRIVLLTAAIALSFTGTASADPGLSATAVCNGKWVAVTVDVPDTAIVVGTWGGKTVAVGNKFVPDTGGGNPTGDYDIDIRLEQWNTTDVAAHKVLASTTVHTPNCGLTATASCNEQWVNVTVTHDSTGWIMARKPGKDWFLSLDRFVPDIGATNPAGDYGIVIEIEQWDRPYPVHKVLAATTVHTPNCGPVAPTATSAPVVKAPPSTTAPVAAPASYDTWKHIVEALRGL